MEEFLLNIGVGIRSIGDPFFEDSHQTCKIFQRKGVTVEDDEELCHEVIREFACYATGCKAIFRTLLDFEMHYNSTHRYVCAECKKPLPNPRLLDIHIQETHDTFFQVLSEKQPMHQCYVSECDLKFKDSLERRNHCISIHKFPKTFRFDNAQHYKKSDSKNKMDTDKVDDKPHESKTTKMLVNRKPQNKMFTAAAKSKIPINPNIPKVQQNMSSSGSNISPLIFVPPQVQKSYTKALTKNQSNERNVLETENMMDLAESLPY